MTIGDDVAAEGADPAAGPLRRRARRPQRAAPSLPGRHARATGAPRRSSSTSHPGPCARRSTAAAAATAMPRRRDAALVLAEVRDGLLSPRAARRDYGVALTADGRSVDADETARLRGGARHELPDRNRRRRHVHRLPRASGDDVRLVHKTSTTPDDPSRGVVTGLAELAGQLGPEPRAARRPARRDRARHDGHDECGPHPQRRARPACSRPRASATPSRCATARARSRTTTASPRRRRSSLVTCGCRVRGRIDYKGDEVEPLERRRCARRGRDVRRGGRRGGRDLVHALADRTRRTSAARASSWPSSCPDAYVTASSDLLPQVRYYDRTSTTVLNAYVGPIITRYLNALTSRLDEARVRAACC